MEKVYRAGSEACETNYRPHIFIYFSPGRGENMIRFRAHKGKMSYFLRISMISEIKLFCGLSFMMPHKEQYRLLASVRLILEQFMPFHFSFSLLKTLVF